MSKPRATLSDAERKLAELVRLHGVPALGGYAIQVMFTIVTMGEPPKEVGILSGGAYKAIDVPLICELLAVVTRELEQGN